MTVGGSTSEPIAIVGRGGVFPASMTPNDLWQHIANGHDVGQTVPADRWYLSPAHAFSQGTNSADVVASPWGCFAPTVPLDATGLPISNEQLAQLDPLIHLGLYAARMAWGDVKGRLPATERRAFIAGNIALPTTCISALARDAWWPAIAKELGCEESSVETIRQAASPLGTGPSRWSQQVMGLPAALISTALEIGGRAFVLDAACASSLYAIKLAMDELLEERCDVVLAGGMARPDCQYTQMGFGQLGALSKQPRCRPLDHQADGLVVGEGAGFFVLKRLSTALSDNDHIYATIHAVGLSNDQGANLLAPQHEGQLRAMQAAYVAADWVPSDIDLIECHATGTPLGDAVELESLCQLWNQVGLATGRLGNAPPVLGSVKSNVGHLLTGAGAASLMKMLFALETKTLPPTANWSRFPEKVSTKFSAGMFPFRGLATAEEWKPRPNGQPRRCAINAFGFGGINAHLLLQEWPADTDRRSPPRYTAPDGTTTTRAATRPLPNHSLDVAIVAAAATIGSSMEPDSLWPALVGALPIVPGAINELKVPIGRFRIPPVELKDSLPQQIAALEVARQCLDQVVSLSPASRSSLGNRCGVFVGLVLDVGTTNFHLRWSLQSFLDLFEHTDTEDLKALREAVHQPLTANRVMGHLGGIVASRLAREFGVGGPAYGLSTEETAGLTALEAASRALARGELDSALVVAVDFPCDRRLVASETAPNSDGAAACYLKPLSAAQASGDQIYAIIEQIDAWSGSGEPSPLIGPSPALTVNATEPFPAGRHQADHHTRAINTTALAGQLGAASGLVACLQATGALAQQYLPAVNESANVAGPRYWLHNASEGVRRAQVFASNSLGQNHRVVLTEPPTTSNPLLAASGLSQNSHDLFLMTAIAPDGLFESLTNLAAEAQAQLALPIHQFPPFAAAWRQRLPLATNDPVRLAIVAKCAASLLSAITVVERWLVSHSNEPCMHKSRQGEASWLVSYQPNVSATPGEIAFVYPGSGNAFAEMGRELLTTFPQVLRHQQQSNQELAQQYRPDLFWEQPTAPIDHKSMIFGQVALGTALTDLLVGFGIKPHATIGYSLGESAALFAIGAWTDRDAMLYRMQRSTLFGSDLVEPFNAARAFWNIPADRPVDWVAGVIDRGSDFVSAAIREAGDGQCYLLIVNSPQQCLIGGTTSNVGRVVSLLGARFVCLPNPSAVHCELLSPVTQQYRDLHLLPTTPIPNVRVYSGATGQPYELNRESAAAATVAQALATVNFQQLIENTWRDGIRTFIEIGPGASCTRMIGETLSGLSHFARPICPATADPLAVFLGVLAEVWTSGYSLDTSYLDQRASSFAPARPSTTTATGPALNIRCHPLEDNLQAVSRLKRTRFAAGLTMKQAVSPSNTGSAEDQSHFEQPQPSIQINSSPDPTVSTPLDQSLSPDMSISIAPVTEVASSITNGSVNARSAVTDQRPITPNGPSAAAVSPNPSLLMQQLAQAIANRAAAHSQFLKLAAQIQQQATRVTERYNQLLSHGMTTLPRIAPAAVSLPTIPITRPVAVALPPLPEQPLAPIEQPLPKHPPRSLSKAECMEFAIGKIGQVLGEQYAAIDAYPTRVRLPDTPLMLVDRILDIEGEPLSMTSGRVITEHDVLPHDWYLDCGHIPVSVAVESGQADLFLAGYLGIDFITKGLAVYRLLDAVVTFHDQLPTPGQVIRYDIRLLKFFRQGETYLFRFEFEGSVAGKPFITMREGCAGFFTPAELAGGKGIVHTALDLAPKPGRVTGGFQWPVPLMREAYSAEQISALRAGDLSSCFGPGFAHLPVQTPVTLPSGKLKLLDRVLELDPQGGKYGLGRIKAEADIRSDDWFLTCHFCDDHVMPGTLMFECCLHTLRVFLLRMGWIGQAGYISYQPIIGQKSRLKCRGQVIESTSQVWYEVSIKELGYQDDGSGSAYCIADALMYADGRAIVEITDMSVRMDGLTKAHVDRLWNSPPPTVSSQPTYDVRPAIYTQEQITAFAIGKPSVAFGDRYLPFDAGRVIARLPGPPFQFLDRIIEVTGQPWKMEAGASCVAQYDVPGDAWYFAANRSQHMPFSVLLETALQPCGWLAAYVGSALTSDTDLSFRNLGGQAIQHADVIPASGTLTTRVVLTKASMSGGMIIQHYSFDLECNGKPVYTGTTYFGFFSKAALADQVGIRDAKRFSPTAADLTQARAMQLPVSAPFADANYRMIDQIDAISLLGGPHGLGFVLGRIAVSRDAWFFKAHFFQDPVWPGSLGVESFLQLLKLYAMLRWQLGPAAILETIAIGEQHEWVYRGQVLPTDREVTVELVVDNVDDAARLVTASGFLIVDGRVIYQMKRFTLRVR
jgi:acyl transferase domain-containing protein/3-hydroxymyristoyl/3-hydroxydecanoyl-(acyl carrier protein) dehydratase